MSGPNLSKEPGDGPEPSSNPYSPSAQDANPADPPAYESTPPQDTPYQSTPPYQGTPYQGAPYQGQYPGAGQGYPYTPPPATNSMALGSLIASIAGWTVVPVVGWIVGIVLGHIARGQLRQSNEQGAGLALAGLITGYAGLALGVLIVVGVFVLAVAFGVGSANW